MNSAKRQYLFGAFFILIGLYQAFLQDYLEVLLCFLAGAGFIINALTFEPRFARYKKALVITSWILIFSSFILFLYVLQFKDISWK